MGEEFKFPSKGIGLTWIMNLVVQVLSSVLPAVTPNIKGELEEFLSGLYIRAKETPNPWDDFLLIFLLRILGITTPKE